MNHPVLAADEIVIDPALSNITSGKQLRHRQKPHDGGFVTHFRETPTMLRLTLASLFCTLIGATTCVGQQPGDAGRTAIRLLHGFEVGPDAADLRRFADNVEIDVVQDNGVTEGRNCIRLVARKGSPYCEFRLGARAIQNWSSFDYFAMDVFTEDNQPYTFVFELWDALSKNYQTRCTYTGEPTHPGKQTLLFRINRAKRNSKEGRDWDELEPQDKIQMDGLKMVKIFVTPGKERDAIFWIDNLRLMQEDAAKPPFRIELPKNAVAFDFGSPGAVVAGFTPVAADTAFAARQTYGFTQTKGLSQAGEGWPDRLTGTFVMGGDGQQLEFKASLANGEYDVWLAAGKILRPDLQKRNFRLQLNDQSLCDEAPSWQEFCSEKFLYRFMTTQYSQKPHALWTNYIDRMYPVHTTRIRVTDGSISLVAVNHFLGGLVLVPVEANAGFKALAAQLREKRIEAFEKSYYEKPRTLPKRQEGDGDFVLFVPEASRGIQPWTGPNANERKRARLDFAAAPGERCVLRLAVTPFRDLGRCRLELGDLKGPGVIPASSVRGYFANYRYDGKDISEMALLPSLAPVIEDGVSQCFWLWLSIPDTAAAGKYQGTFVFHTEAGAKVDVPVECEVYPFRLKNDLPASFGMYYGERQHPPFPAEERRRLLKEQLQWMREVGFTAVPAPAPTVLGLKGGDQVSLRFDTLMYELAREVGMAARPEQKLMATQLGMARAIGRRLPGSQGAKVDQQPGIELRQPEFERYYKNAAGQYRDFLTKTGLPVAVEICDEPRETPNPWNRNLADSLHYARLLREVGCITTFITPMSDGNSGKDYSVFPEHVDIVSIHGWKASEKLLRRTHELKKTLWLYNTGMDRLSWGFYNWRVGSTGRWEWHFSFPSDDAHGGYPGREWHNPFTGLHGYASNAPDSHPGGMLFQSAFLRASEGITDYAYLHTLEEALKTSKNTETAKKARVFLDALKRIVPEFPEVKGLANPEDAALVGLGLNDAVQQHLPAWRKTIAEFLKEL